MTDLLESLKQKYSDDVGWSFSFFEGITYFIYLITSYEFMCGPHTGIWNNLLGQSVYKLLVGDSSIFASARVLDFLIAVGFSVGTVYTYGVIKRLAYGFLSSIKNLDDYVDKLKSQFESTDYGTQAMRIYIANEVREQKRQHMKHITMLNGFGLIALAAIVSAIVGLINTNYIDFSVLVLGLITLVLIQWLVFTHYILQIVPRLVFERVARGENVDFGDELE